MNASGVPLVKSTDAWLLLLLDQKALLGQPGARYKLLVDEAHALHRAGVIDHDHLSDLLEQADGALAYAVEALLDEHENQ